MKIGLISCCYNCEEILYKCFAPWLNAKEILHGLDDIFISICHGQFKEYHDLGQQDSDEPTLNLLKNGQWIDYLYVQNDNAKSQNKKYSYEYELRDKLLQKCLKEKCDVIWILDPDEIYTETEIINCITFLKKNEFISWFDIEFKNLVFNDKTYTKGFCPPRIFRGKSGGLKLNKVFWDNDLDYISEVGAPVTYKALAKLTIPTHLCNPLHYTWLSNEKTKSKIKYQERHFASGAGCSFKWNDELNQLEWNKDYFAKTNQSIPELFKSND